MIASEPESPNALLEESPAFISETRAPILALEPVEKAWRLPPILLDGRCQLVGGDGDSSIAPTGTDIRKRNAVIQHVDGLVVVRAGELPVWLNGEPVAESPLREGDRLKIGVVEFCVRTATTDELLANLPGRASIFHFAGDPAAARWLTLRRARLRALRARLKERYGELECEFERLRAERTQFEAERLGCRQERLPGGSGQKSSPGVARGAPGAFSALQDPLAISPATDSDRMNRLFQKQMRQPAAASPPPPAAADSSQPATTSSLMQATPDAKPAGEQSDGTDSVADYMQSLLGRLRAGRAAGVTPEAEVYDDWDRGPKPVPVIDPSVKLGPPIREVISGDGAAVPLSPSESAQGAAPKRRVCAIQARAELRSFRAVANASARSAVTSHTLRKLKRSVRWLLPLAIFLSIVSGVFLVRAVSQSRYSWLTFSTAILAVAALIKLTRTVRKIRRFDSCRAQPDSECASDEPAAEIIEVADGTAPAESK